MIRAQPAADYESTRGVAAWYRLTRGHSAARSESWDWSGELFNLTVVRRCQPKPSRALGEPHPRVPRSWVSRQKIQTKVPDSCRVIVRSLVPKDSDKDQLKILPEAKYTTTNEYILEQVSLRRGCPL